MGLDRIELPQWDDEYTSFTVRWRIPPSLECFQSSWFRAPAHLLILGAQPIRDTRVINIGGIQ